MKNETLHLLYWFFVWIGRAIRTMYHIIYRPAYRKFKRGQYFKNYHGRPYFKDYLGLPIQDKGE